MVGIVLVSHSAVLAEAVKALAEQQTQGKAAIAAVGGTGDPEHPFGTDAMAILAAIQSVDQPDGVLVLMDLGSALLSAETALEFLEDGQRARVRLASAPFVEGAMAAAVQASIGMDLDAVAREAAEALGPKLEMLGAPTPVSSPAVAAPTQGESTETVTLVNPAGLHFGPAVQFVQAASAFAGAGITVRNLTTGAGPADARRFNQVLGLGAEQGHRIEIRSTGADAEAALDRLVKLAVAGFGELGRPAAGQAPPSPPAEAALPGAGRETVRGVPASPGVAVGIAARLAQATAAFARLPRRPAADEWNRFETAAAVAHQELLALAVRMARELGEEQARIFEAHALALADPDFTAAVRAGIEDRRLSAEVAVSDVAETEAVRFEGMSGVRFQERAADLRDLRTRLLRLLTGGEETAFPLPERAVILADDLAPSQTATLDREHVVAFCTALGGPTAHSAILARSMGIPAVVGLGVEALARIPEGTEVAIDGGAGTVIVEPDAATVAAYVARSQSEADARAAARLTARAEARTADGRRVEVAANLATGAEALAAVDAGAEGVGLLRTEFLFQDRTEPPTEEEQYRAYRQVVEAMAPRPVIIRTLDIGGDKPAPYLRLPAELNPFLGWRAIRVCLAMPEFFKVQLRAILRAACHGQVRVMFPMIAVRAEVERARALLVEAAAELAASGVAHQPDIPVGIMVEVPAAAETPDLLAPAVDFFSVGTNDLTQYTFAADRGNARVADLADSLHPAILRQLDRIITAAHAHGRWAGMCGELAGDPVAIPILLGLGLDEFSMSATRIPEAKALLAGLETGTTRTLAQLALDLPDGLAVRAAVAAFMAGQPKS